MSKIYSQKMLMSLAGEINQAYSQFNVKQFEKKVFDKNWEKKRDQEKVAIVTQTIYEMIDQPYLDQLDVLLKVCDNAQYRWVNLILPNFVSVYGLNHFDESMFALKEFTKICTSEYGIRPFVKKYPEESAFLMFNWAKDEHFRVRRLASEGSRPYLPGGLSIQHFVENPLPILPILDRLKQDKELYVKKSVSNSLNDISKGHPDLVIKICREWKTLHDANTDYIIQRACRTLFKKGNEDALQIIQEVNDGPIQITNLRVKQNCIRMGDSIDFSFKIEDTSFDMKHTKDTSMDIEDDENDEISQTRSKQKMQKMDVESNDSKNKGFKIEFCIQFLKMTEEYDSKIFLMEQNHIMKSKIESFEGRVSTNDFTTKNMFAGDNYLSILIDGVQKYKIYYQLQHKK